jgi:phage gpG-like protein
VVEVGSNLPYAGIHHSGGESESLPITQDVQERLWDWLRNKGAELKKRLGWLLNAKFRDQTLKMQVPERPIVGITAQTIADVREVVCVEIMEAT